jgi:hypothetical protein
MSNLVDRLRGIYNVPVDDGAGLLDGKDTFTRTFPVTPICIEAANKIEQLEEVMHWAQAMLTALNVGDIQSESLLHKKLREVMIHYREISEENS